MPISGRNWKKPSQAPGIVFSSPMRLPSWRKNSLLMMLMTGDSDCGKKMGYMQAFVNYGLRNLKEGAKFRRKN
jgi:hypothetical protein